MKKYFLITCFLMSISVFAQEFGPVLVTGQIVVERNDLSGISILNKTSNLGTITNSKGEFSLQVALNDLIEVSAIQYTNLSFSVNEDIITSKSMKIFLIEEINKLEEVVVYSKGLTGDLVLDIKDKTPYKPKLDVLYFGIKNKDKFDFETDYTTKITTSDAVRAQLPTLINGLNIVNVVDQLLLPLFRSELKNKKDVDMPEVPAGAVKYYFGSEFLVNNFNIPEHRVEEFIRFVESENFDLNLLNYGHEMEFLQVLSEQSQIFLKQ